MTSKKVAVLGFAYRLPGTTRDHFWPDLLAGKNLVTQVPFDRWAREQYQHPRKSFPGTSYTFAAGSVGDVFAFDAEFFGISPREAAQMDPQQRLLLELSWEVLENAGIRPSDIRGSQCSVYIGISTNDYSLRFADDLVTIDSSVATGTTSSIAANRISYALDLRGPSMAVDTACSSSLVAFHLACRSIASGESTHAIAGGVSLHLHPYGFVAFSKASMLSNRGRCNVFDASADGYVRSEGAGVFFLKNYDKALADGDRILAVVAASVVNSDGRMTGLTVPSVESQVALLSQACSDAAIAPSDIDYIEAHGTGTAVGDPVETHALGEALGKCRPKDAPLLIGSVKSNLGHLEAAAGVAGLVKALHCIEHRTVPATIHLDKPNPNIRFDEWNLKVVTETTPLKEAGKLLIGVNSFGFGGANAHVILESPDIRQHEEEPGNQAGVPLPVVISGKSAAALKAAARDLSRFLQEQNEGTFYDIAYSAAFHREWHEHRAIFQADRTTTLGTALEQFADDTPAALPVETGIALSQPTDVAFIYSGNGSVWDGMGKRLMAEAPVFRDAVLAVDEIFRQYASYSLQDELTGKNGPGRYEYTEVAQPALFALQVGVTQMLRQHGITPAAVAGHSVGEIAAAWASGALSLEQAVRVIYHRSRLQGTTKGKGRMTAVGLGEQAARQLLEELGLSGILHVTGINSSQSVTVAGEVSGLDQLEVAMAERGFRHTRLDLDYAFHSPAMDPIHADIVSALADLRTGQNRIPFHSSVTGGRLEATALGADYWWRNIRDPVLFEKVIKNIRAQGVNVFVEIGPHAVLRGYINNCLIDEGIHGRVIPTVQRDDGNPGRIWSAACQAAIAGSPVDWKAQFPYRGRFVRLPNYPWQRERYWDAGKTESRRRLHRHKDHPLLGYRLQESEWAWECEMDTLLYPTLADHVVGNATVMPGTGYAEMAVAAARLWQGKELVEIEQLEIRAPLILGENQSKILRFSIDAPDGSFTVKSRDHPAGETWTVHAVGRILEGSMGVVPQQAPLVLPARPADFSGADHDKLTKAVGLDYGPAFRAIEAIWVEDGSAYARFRIPEVIESELERVHLHPALADCAFQLIIQLLKDEYVSDAGTVYVPVKIDGLLCRTGKARLQMARATIHRHSADSLTASFTLFDADGEDVAWFKDARFNRLRLRKNPSDRLRYLGCHYVPKPHALSPVSAPPLMFERLHKKLSKWADAAVRSGALKRYASEVEPLLDVLCSRFAVQALRSLAANGDVLTEAQAYSQVNPDTVPLLLHLIGVLKDHKAITAVGNDWRFLPESDSPAAQDIWNSLLADYPDFLPVFHAVGRVGLHLADLLRDRRTLEQILPRDCTPSRLFHRVFADAGLSAMSDAIGDFIADTLARLPADKRLRVIEVGAGRPTFGATACKVIDFGRCDYVFATTVSSMPEEGQRLHEMFPRAELRLIDPASNLEAPAPPVAERFQLALVTLDVATEDKASLAISYAKRHLCAGGSLLIVEQHPSRWMDFVFGGRRAWWTEAQDGSWVSRHKSIRFRRHQLQELGFQSGIELELSEDDGNSGPYVLLSQRAERADASAQPIQLLPRTWLLLADREGFSARFAAQLTRRLGARGDRVIQATPGGQLVTVDTAHYRLNPCDSSHFEALLPKLADAFGQLDGILHLYGLNASSAGGAPPLLLEQQVDRCAAVAAMLQACESTGTKTTCWLVTSRAAPSWPRERDRHAQELNVADCMDAALSGFGQTLMNETSNLAVRLIDVDAAAALDATTYALVEEISHPDLEHEIVLRGSGERYVPRLRVEPPPATAAEPATDESLTVRLGLQFQGQLRSLRWELHPRVVRGDDELEIQVRATGLNFRDVMCSLGLLSGEMIDGGVAGPTLGLEFAGVVLSVGERVRGFAPGDRVAGFGPGSFGNRVVTKASCVSPIPPGLPFAAAATVPSAFLTAHYALNHLARLQPGERVLIHGAAGGVGIAAVQIAKWRGAEICATAGSDEKRDFLHLLGADYVFDSRSLAFADEILAITDGGGVDVVLNSLAGEAINRNLRVLKPFGRFLELGKRDFQENTRIGLRPFRNNISYFGIDADQLMKERPDLTQTLFREVMALFDEGALHPLPYDCFAAEDIVNAFRHMQQSRHIGKIVVTYEDGLHPVHSARRDQRRFELRADATYLVTGGLSGFGLKAAAWMASRGARNLVLISRSGPVTAEACDGIATLAHAGATVHAAACDVTDTKAFSALLSEIADIMPPLRGIVHAAAVIEDGLIRNMTRDQIRRVFAPKILGAQHLHEMTLDKKLDLFVLFSSATTLFGNPGQANYVAANACLEALAAFRRAIGMPALCVRWGAIDDAGFLARNVRIKEALLGRIGGSAITADVALESLEELLLADRSGLGVMDLDWKALTRFLPCADTPKFSELARSAEDVKAEEDGERDVRHLLATLSAPELLVAFGEMLKTDVAEILRASPDKIDEYRSIYDIGFDSLMGVELATAVEGRFGVRLPVMALSENPTIARLSARILALLTSVDEAGEGFADASIADQTRQLATQHADDAHADVIATVATQLQSEELAPTGKMIH